MRQFRIPGEAPSTAPGIDRKEKRKLALLAVGTVLVAAAFVYGNYRGKSYSKGELDEVPLEGVVLEERVHLPDLDAARIEALVADAEPLERVVLESEGLDALLDDARRLTPRSFEALETRELDAALIETIAASPATHRAQPFMVRGSVDSIRTRRRGAQNEVEHIARLVLEDDSIAYALTLDAPEDGGFVRVDGLFLKLYSDEDEMRPGEWLEGPLLVGPQAIRSYRALGRVDEPHWGLYGSVEDAALVPADGSEPKVVRETPFEPFWHMMALARDLPADAVDWEEAPELDRDLLLELQDSPDEWRARPIRIPLSRVQDGRVIRAGENPARIEYFTQGWFGNWNWPNVVRFKAPVEDYELDLRDYAFGNGFFLHNFAYESAGRGLRVAPLIVMTELTRFENKEDPIWRTLALTFGGVATGLMLLFGFLLVRDKRRSIALQSELVRRRRLRRERQGIGGPAGSAGTTGPR
jgi:hypothetical protein